MNIFTLALLGLGAVAGSSMVAIRAAEGNETLFWVILAVAVASLVAACGWRIYKFADDRKK